MRRLLYRPCEWAAVLPPDLLAALKPEAVTALVALLAAESCPVSGSVFELGAGWAARLRWQRARGAWLGTAPSGWTPEALRDQWFAASDDFPSSNRFAYPDSNASALEAIADARESSGGGSSACCVCR